jgi:hypothetical protein
VKYAVNGLPTGSTLEEAKEWLLAQFEDGGICPCCEQVVKLYKRKLNSFMAYSLILFHGLSAKYPPNYWVHIKESAEIAAGGGEFPRLRHWGLIEERPGERADGGKHRGYWRITTTGHSFIQGAVSVPRHIYMYNQQVIVRANADQSRTTIQEALGNKFNYNELMAATPDGSTT